MSSITYLKLDANYDPIFDPAASLQDLQAIEQAIKTRILLLEGEWWEDLNLGTPLFQLIIGARATPNGQQVMAAALGARISGTPFVTAIQKLAISLNPKNRALSFAATAQTQFGTVTVPFEPGAQAGTEG